MEWKISQLANNNTIKQLKHILGAVGSSHNTSIGGQGLTISNLNQINPFTANVTTDWNNDWTNPNVKRYEVIELTEDLLVLSATWNRLRILAKQDVSNYVNITSLTDTELFKYITSEDHEKASKIRDYYSKKIMMWTLKGMKLSRFREDLNQFIHSNGKVFKETMSPLVYRLPEFYDYDIEFDSMFTECNKEIKQEPRVVRINKTLSLQKTFVVGKRYNKRKEYWFSDGDKNLVTFSVTNDNPLIPLLDKHISTPINMYANYSKRTRDDVEYLIADKYNFG